MSTQAERAGAFRALHERDGAFLIPNPWDAGTARALEALGYRTVIYRTIANCLGAAVATLAGVLYALWLRYTGPNTTLDFAIMIDILLMVVIGGMGTMYGAVLGATIFVVAQNYLQDLMKLASDAAKGIPLLPDLLHPDRWLLWFGVLFVLSVYYFPRGIVGQLRAWRA